MDNDNLDTLTFCQNTDGVNDCAKGQFLYRNRFGANNGLNILTNARHSNIQKYGTGKCCYSYS